MNNTYQTIIRAGRRWWRIDWCELLEYQNLLWLMVKRDLTAIYKQTILGPLWFIIQRLITTIVFTIIFGKVAKISTDGIPLRQGPADFRGYDLELTFFIMFLNP